MGVQQCLYQTRGWVEGSIQNQPRLVWANGHALWTNQFTHHILMDDERHLQKPHHVRSSNHLSWQHSYHVKNERRTSSDNTGSLEGLMKAQTLPEGREVQIWSSGNRVLGSHHQRRQYSHGPGQNQRNYWVADTYQEKRTPVIFGIHKFLQVVHQRLQQNHKANDTVDREQTMEMGSSTTKHVWTAKKTASRRCGISNTNEWRKVPCQSACHTVDLGQIAMLLSRGVDCKINTHQ